MKVNGLLKVTGILYILNGALGIVSLLAGLAFGGILGAAAGDVSAGVGLMILLMISTIISILLSFLAGINGVRGRNLKLCLAMGIVLLILGAFSLIVNAASRDSITASMISMIISILYIFGVARQRAA
ncbi:hypothetical protein [Cuneatibacter caecimuris]|uniref:Uncharacterized protein n=1 Tax=Cuneatibacter caecimuris TaxID=1796618 RepID=A0A4Q7PIQ0_9FIRM|nr:hypothetical protein [Cuneatibacter caecimuris]RZT00504.1 hypothetical protein EV209_1818 [Cuneatibacter caecimuris]